MHPILMLVTLANVSSNDELVGMMEEAIKEYKLIPTEDNFSNIMQTSTLLNMKQAIESIGFDEVVKMIKSRLNNKPDVESNKEDKNFQTFRFGFN